MQVVTLSTAELAGMAAPYNPRKISERDLEALRRSLRYFGVVEPVVVNERTGRIVGGHQRVLAAQAEGIAELPVVYVDLDEPSEKQLNLALNRISGAWDEEKLGAVLRELEALGADLDLTGFEDSEIERLLQEIADGQTDPDEVPDKLPKRCSPGDLWRLGEHRLLCGDATSGADMQRLLAGEAPALTVTDPPYGVEYHPEWRTRDLGKSVRRTAEVKNDDRADWEETWRLVPSDVIYAWCAPGELQLTAGQALVRAGFQIRAQIIWRKPHFPVGRGHYHFRHEPCWYAVRKGAKAHWIGDRKQSTVWDVELDETAPGGHSTQKPVELMRRAIANHQGDVLDPFCGSGSTLIAAEQLGRRCFAMEINPEYCDIIIERWQRFTGQQAEKVG